MKICVICHGNIARSQVLHHYIEKSASEATLTLDVFSCGTAPLEAYSNVEILLTEVQMALNKRGIKVKVIRNILDDNAKKELEKANIILVADHSIKNEVLRVLKQEKKRKKVSLFYEYIGEGTIDFIDTYDRKNNCQDPTRFTECFDELERIAKKTVQIINAKL